MHISKYNPAKYKFVMLLCYKQSYIKHALNQKAFIEPNIMNFASLYLIQPNFTKSSRSVNKKCLDKSLS